MRFLILLFAASLVAGCRSPAETLLPDSLPRPIGEVFLPVYPTEVPYSIQLTVRALIAADGTVVAAEIAPRSGNDQWDSLASAAVRSWRFTPARQSGRSVQAWIKFPVTLQFAEAHPIVLAEIVLPSRALADSVYALLVGGADFPRMARRFSVGATAADSGYLGPRHLKDYSLDVQMAITSVGHDQVTRPVMMAGSYVIFKRLRDAVPAD